jgi:hypothetical protein
LDPSDSYFLFADLVGFYTHWTYMHIFRHIFLSNYWWQKSDILSQASYRYPISWEVFLDPSDSYFLFADLVGFYTHWTYILYMPIFSRISLSNYWWQKSDIWSQASYRYSISWEAFFDPSDSYFLFAEERGYHKWALAHSSSCYICVLHQICLTTISSIVRSELSIHNLPHVKSDLLFFTDEIIQCTAMTWLTVFISKAGRTLLLNAPGIIRAVLPCVTNQSPKAYPSIK